MTSFSVLKYNPGLKKEWDDFVEKSKNGTFLFNRNYMDYHSHRFEDHSLMFYKGGRICALLPANIIGTTVYSHSGLTYGGLIMDRRLVTEDVLKIFRLIKEYYLSMGFYKLIYKPVPHIYHKLPSEEDLYALFRNDGRIIGRNVSSTVLLSDRIRFRNIRKSGIRKAFKADLKVDRSFDFSSFWKILENNLKKKYSSAPVHSLEEIEKLSLLFPQNIQLFSAYEAESNMVGGVVCYVTAGVAHVQYISASSFGLENGAIDLIFDYLLNTYFTGYKYFDFGTSNEDKGRFLNESLIYQKEGFGGRAICYDIYELEF